MPRGLPQGLLLMDKRLYDEGELFDKARSFKEKEERLAYLKSILGEDKATIDRIESLIVAGSEAETFFVESAAVVDEADELVQLRGFADDPLSEEGEFHEEKVGVKIDRYSLIKRIGDGGCGVVYLAEQEEPVRRMVAVKIVRIGMESPHVVARFKAERQALAMMDHPNIAHVYDAGETQNGSPYFVMEHVRGTRITTYCDENKLHLNERLRLFIQVCHAIQHAHQKGIIHGDIKPSNIMVCQQDGEIIPKVIDFGIARVTESRLTQKQPNSKKEQLIGTPAYMSPEQLDMNGFDVDTRSDLYSLGILLFELLVGETPFAGLDFSSMSSVELRRTIQESNQLTPSEKIASITALERSRRAECRGITASQLSYSLKSDLDYVVNKASAKDRTLRYETANGLAMDIDRFLNHQMPLAHPGSWTHSFLKLIRRNKAAFIGGALVAATMVAGLGVSTMMFLRERDAKQRALAAEHQQVKLREEAELSARITEASLHISQNRYPEADRIVQGIPLEEPSLEGASVLRMLGEWHATNGEWEHASDRFHQLLKINQFENADVSSLDILELGPCIVKSGDFDAYERFRDSSLERFSEAHDAFADRFLKITLLRPANGLLLRRLEPMVAIGLEALEREEKMGIFFEAAWRSMSIALYEYRSGNNSESIRWCRKCLDMPDHNDPRKITALAILSMNYQEIAANDDAERVFLEAQRLWDLKKLSKGDRGTPVHGFWFDWTFADILLQEASGLISNER